jgi:hypothetical protein
MLYWWWTFKLLSHSQLFLLAIKCLLVYWGRDVYEMLLDLLRFVPLWADSKALLMGSWWRKMICHSTPLLTALFFVLVCRLMLVAVRNISKLTCQLLSWRLQIAVLVTNTSDVWNSHILPLFTFIWPCRPRANRMRQCAPNSSGSRYGQVAGLCKGGNESFRSIMCREILD